MRLLFHEIRPVVVFDGAMPEVKRREIQRRKDRREKLWRDEEDGEEGGGALKRTAKKLLVQRLKEWRKKEAKLTGVENIADNDEDVKSKQKPSSSENATGAFAAGFVPADSQSQHQGSSEQHQSTNEKSDALTEVPKPYEADNDIISIQSDHEIDQLSTNNNDEDSENDWEMSHAVQSSINASLSNQQSSNLHDETDIQPETSNAVIAALPTITRSQWIDSQFRAQRIQSRQECISVAGNMEEYSSTQIRNFLKGSRLNKRMNDIGALAGKSAVENGDGAAANAETVNSNAHETLNVSMEVLFGEPDDDGDGDNINSDEESAGGGFLSSSDLKHTNLEPLTLPETDAAECLRESEDEGDNIEQVDTSYSPGNNEHHIELNIDTTSAEGARHNQQSKLIALASAQDEWAAWGNDEESEEATKPRSKNNGAVTEQNTTRLQSDDSDSDEEGDTFLTLACSSSVNNHAMSSSTNNIKIEDTNQTAPGEDTKQTAPGDTDAESKESNADMSVDWEDGDSGDEGPGDTTNETHETCLGNDNTTHATKASTKKNQMQDQTESKNVHTNATIEDTFATGKIKATEKHGVVNSEDGSSNAIYHDADSPKFDQESASATVKQPTILLNDTDGDVSIQENYINEFDIPQPEDPNIAALQHAQETASKLTNWAGRAVQRAFASHLEHHKDQSSPQERSTSKVDEVDLTESNDGNKSPKHPTSQKATGSPHNDTRKCVEFLDTSLEGLNAAHHEILEEEKLMERDMSTITDEMKEDILKLLQLCGIPWIESPAEAEAQCAALEELGLVDGVVTEDSDIFVFGGRKVYKVSSSSTWIMLDGSLSHLPFSHRTFSMNRVM
jgi:hypothetical protein